MSHRYLVLGLLNERPMTGYDIKKHVKVTFGAAISASYGTLYPTLHKLQEEGAVVVEDVPQNGRPSKKVYHITSVGQQALETWLRQPAAADQVRREFLLKFYFGKNLSAAELLAILESRRDETNAMLRLLRAEKKGNLDLRQNWMVDYALSLCEAEINWLERVEAQISAA